MQDALPQIEQAGGTLVAVSNDEPHDRDALVAKLALDFPVLADTDLSLTEAFGLVQADKDMPLPATYIVSNNGTILWRVVGENPVVRPLLDDILAALR